VAESLSASRFPALKGLQIVARGKGAQRPPPRVWGRHQVSPSPRCPVTIAQKRAPDGGERDGEWGRATSSPPAGFHPPCVQPPDLWVNSSLTKEGVFCLAFMSPCLEVDFSNPRPPFGTEETIKWTTSNVFSRHSLAFRATVTDQTLASRTNIPHLMTSKEIRWCEPFLTEILHF
jgi:hypothetical protein